MKLDESCRTLKLMERYENWWKSPGCKIDENCRARKVWNLIKTAAPKNAWKLMKTDENRRGLKLMKIAGPERYETWWKPMPWNLKLMKTAGPLGLNIDETWWASLKPKLDENRWGLSWWKPPGPKIYENWWKWPRLTIDEIDENWWKPQGP